MQLATEKAVDQCVQKLFRPGTPFAHLLLPNYPSPHGCSPAARPLIVPCLTNEAAMPSDVLIDMDVPSEAHDFYRRALEELQAAKVPFLVGGAFALAWYAGVGRFTKDFDLFLLPSDVDRALRILKDAGWR